MFCEEKLPFSLCSSILLFTAISLESIPLIIGIVLMTLLTNISVQSYTIDLEKCEPIVLDKDKIAIKQKYKCANFGTDDDYKCPLEDGVFDESGYKMLDCQVMCPMCYSVHKKKNKSK